MLQHHMTNFIECILKISIVRLRFFLSVAKFKGDQCLSYYQKVNNIQLTWDLTYMLRIREHIIQWLNFLHTNNNKNN